MTPEIVVRVSWLVEPRPDANLAMPEVPVVGDRVWVVDEQNRSRLVEVVGRCWFPIPVISRTTGLSYTEYRPVLKVRWTENYLSDDHPSHHPDVPGTEREPR